MLTTDKKTLVTYTGGSGGDLFVSSINGISIESCINVGITYIPFSIKHLEKDIEANKLDIKSAIDNINFEFISTHLIHNLPFSTISIVVKSTEILNTIVCRQMQLQKISLTKDSGTFYNLIKNLIKNKNWSGAANLWFNMAERLTVQQMQQRMQMPGPKLDFSMLFSTNFVDSLITQGWNVHTDTLSKNHKTWLAKQPEFSKKISLEYLENKIKLLDI
jgi:hypothetical protein